MPARLERLSIRQILLLYATLPAVPAAAREGNWYAGFIGPWWLRATAGPGIALGGMPGWAGKRFDTPQTAVNLLGPRTGLREVLPMRCAEQPSWYDGQPCTALSYERRARIPWRWVRDELRQLDENLWLCLTFIDLPLLRRLPCPFVLVRNP
jgi:hypothetical protein